MQIVLSGSLAVDQIMSFDGRFSELIQPDKLQMLSISVLLKNLQKTRGGTAGNIAYSLALLGEQPLLYAAIGEDQRQYMVELAQLGVDISRVHYSKLPSASFSVFTDSADCQVGGFYPGAMSDAQSLLFKKLDQTDNFFVISAHDPAQMAVQIDECLTGGYRMLFDVGQQVITLSPEVLSRGLAAAEVLVLNDYELKMLAQRIGKTTTAVVQQVPVCIVTSGVKGSCLYTKTQDWKPTFVTAVPVKQALDPTGAGDAFRAGFLYGYVRDWPLTEAVQLGATLAAYVVEQYGTQSHQVTKKALQERYANHYQQQLEFDKKGN